MKILVQKEMPLLEYLYANLNMPKKRIKQYLTHGSIFINNNKITQFDYQVYPGMNIQIDTTNKSKKTLPFDIIFEDEHIIVVNKPSNLLTIATNKEKEKTLYHIVREYLLSKNKNNKIFVVHRLDKDTSGLVILAKDEKTKILLQTNWNDFVKLREYTAVIHGTLSKKEGRIEQFLQETSTNLTYVSKNNIGKKAITNYKILKESSSYSLVNINIETGRKNQIRVAFSSLNHPIVGDKKYGLKKDTEKRLFLHANRLKIYYPYLKKELLFEVPIPNEFKNILKEKKENI